MQIDQTTSVLSTVLLKTRRCVGTAFALLVALVLITATSAAAQNALGVASGSSGTAAISLLSAPEVEVHGPQPAIGVFVGDASSSSSASLADEPEQGQLAPIYTKYILPDMSAQPLGARDKVMIGLKDTYSPMNFGGMFAAAGYEQLRNSEPNYGTDRGAFGERLGAAAIRDTLEGMLTDAVYAPLLHEDPRYYVEGSQYGTVHRALYALTRPLITRTDSGRKTINGALLLGYASSSLLTDTYYPAINRNARDTAEVFGSSVGGSALGFLVTEFSASLWHDLHFGHKQ